ncbi:MAG: PDZ domain-containing protein [bacterium]|nr:MAG: PDZ domain-containing protein [bacterium]
MKRSIIIISSVLTFLLILTLIAIPNGLLAAEKESKNKGFLGVSIQELTRNLRKELKADYGVVITSIEEDSPADKYGLMEDDVIQKVNDVKIRRASTLTRIIRKIKPGEKAKIAVIRDGKEKTVTVTIGKLKKSWSYSYSHGPKLNVFKWYGGGAYLGVQLHELNEDLASYFGAKEDEGALILEVEQDSPAEEAGLKSGDVIIKIDGETISDPTDVQEIISDLEEDDEIKIEIIRHNRKQTIQATLSERESHHNIFISPNKRIRELELRYKPDKSIDLLLPDFKRDNKLRKMIIDKQRSKSTRAI